MCPSPAPAYCRSTHSTEVRRTLHAVGYQGAIFPDYVSLLVDDTDWRHNCRAFAVGDRHGVIDAIEADE